MVVDGQSAYLVSVSLCVESKVPGDVDDQIYPLVGDKVNNAWLTLVADLVDEPAADTIP